MNLRDAPPLIPPPAHEAVIERAATEAQAEISLMAILAREALEERFSRIVAFRNRSAGQRKRFLRARQILQEQP